MSSPIKNGVSSIAVVVYRRMFPLPSWAAPTLVTCNSAEVLEVVGAARKNMFVKAKTARSVVNQVFLKCPRTLSMCVDMYVQKFTAIYMTYMSVTCL